MKKGRQRRQKDEGREREEADYYSGHSDKERLRRDYNKGLQKGMRGLRCWLMTQRVREGLTERWFRRGYISSHEGKLGNLPIAIHSTHPIFYSP